MPFIKSNQLILMTPSLFHSFYQCSTARTKKSSFFHEQKSFKWFKKSISGLILTSQIFQFVSLFFQEMAESKVDTQNVNENKKKEELVQRQKNWKVKRVRKIMTCKEKKKKSFFFSFLLCNDHFTT